MPLAPHTTRGPRGHRQLPHPLSHGKPRLPAAPPPCGPRAPREVPPHGPRQPLLRSARGQHSPRLAAAPRDAPGRSPARAQQRRPAPSFLAEARASLQGDVVLPSRSPVLGVLDGPAPGDTQLGREAERGELPKGNKSKSRAQLWPELRCPGRPAPKGEGTGQVWGCWAPRVRGDTACTRPTGDKLHMLRALPTATWNRHPGGVGSGGAGAAGARWAGGVWMASQLQLPWPCSLVLESSACAGNPAWLSHGH